MTDLMEKALDKVRQLPAYRQDEIAMALLDMSDDPVALTDAEIDSIKRGRSAYTAGDVASEDEVIALFQRLRAG